MSGGDEKSGEGVLPPITAWKHAGDEKKTRWADLTRLMTTPSARFAPPPFKPAEEDFLGWLQEDRRVLVVGAGGLGCEILKDLALSGVKDIEVIDLDIIELSNLNRQFLFRKKDINAPKSKTAAEFVMKRVPGVSIKWHNKPIQQFPSEFYSKFDCVIAGLDNIEARRWLNATLYDLVEQDDDGNVDPDSIIPFVDGGTEAFAGQVRVFVPRVTSCFECSMGTITKQKGFQSCTIASIPRRPEHCIAYAHKVLWKRLRSLKTADDYDMVPVSDKGVDDPCGVDLDTDDVDHMSWIYRRAEERGKDFKIEGVTYTLTMQVVKNIIPAIASTNALVSAACVNECIKALTWCNNGLNNYFMYMGKDGIYSRTFSFDKNPQCTVCGVDPITYVLDGQKTLFKHLYAKILRDDILKLKKPSVQVNGKPLYLSGKTFAALYADNMEKKLADLFESESVCIITDTAVLGRSAAKIKVRFEEGAIYLPPKEE